jgi:predicted dehydrogenase
MQTKLRFAVIGAGAIGLHHMQSITGCARAELVAVAETNPGRLDEAAARFKVPHAYKDYEPILRRDDVDAVSIALPNFLHAPVALAALKAGKHVHLDKPMAFNAREAAAIIALAKKKKLTFMVGQNQRFSKEAQMLKVAVDKGILGDVYHGRAWWIRRAGIPRIGSWFTQKKYSGGGCLLDIGVHMLDLCLHLMGNFKAVAVSGITHARFGPRGLGGGGWGKSEIDPKAKFDVDDYACALIKLQGGKSVILEVAWAAHTDNPSHGVQIFGTEGGGSVFPCKIYHKSTEMDGYDVITPQDIKVPLPEDRLHHFTNCVLDRKPVMVKPEQSLAIQKILDAIYQSSRTGREVLIR